ncbi:MAG: hypothetical protein MI807_18965 [Verrucomicrobiales bacterium]|nr:hypothetical protein [Verrucomicrobiales bacterium]
MFLRFVPFFIVCFWLASVAWLSAVIWAPPESRMAQVDPRQVYDIFFAWNESTNMTLLDNGVRRGQITIAGSSGENPDTAVFEKTLSVSGVLESPEDGGGMPALNTDLFWRGLLDFSEALHLMGGSFSVRVPRQGLTAHLDLERKPDTDPAEISKDAFQLRARATLAGQEVFSIDSEKIDDLTGSPIPFAMLPMQSMIDLETINPAEWKLENDARVGRFTIGGRELRAYLLTFRKDGGEGAVRVFLSEVGEPLRIETDFGVEAVSEILVPLDAYRDTKEKKEP